MQILTLNNGVPVPQLGLGVWPLTDAQAYAAVSHALTAGYRHIDTAQVYDNETGVGRAIRDAGIPRRDIFLTTKLWNADQGYQAALRAFDACLERLGTDYLDLYLTKPGSRSWSPPMSCRCSSTPARPPASPRCWAHSVSYASSCAASSRHAAEKAASLVPRRRRDRPETTGPRSQVVPSQGLGSARLMVRQRLETPKPQVRSFLHLRLAVGRVGLEPKLVMRLTCENAAEADIHIPLRPAASASIRGNRTAVRYVPHHYKAALARTGAGNPPGPICGSASRHGPPAVQAASSAHLPPLARVGDPPYRPSTYRNLTRRAYSPRLLGNGAPRLGTSGSAL
ncbi:aldo/keto reductase [Streptomyces sp. NPDC088727]|uniref:aldo/keto reductase n=1 Tax=Streptomyces sp. NPDC088727 TaxID=3365875 RepID=UPI0037F7D9B2